MSVASEITRLQNAKIALKTAINSKTDLEHQIDDETIDEYSDFVDSIQTGGGGGRLPSDYQEVEYIGITDGNGYIDTGFKPTYNTKVETRASITNSWLCGEDSGWLSNGFGILRTALYFSNKTAGVNINTDVHDFVVSKDGGYVDNELKNNFSGANSFNATNNLYLFANNRNNVITEWGKGTIYTFKIYESEILVRNYVPCYKKSNNAIGLYDLVNEEFVTPSGSGVWIKGSRTDISLQTKNIRITENTTTNVTADSQYDGLKEVSIVTAVSSSTPTKGYVINSWNTSGLPTSITTYGYTYLNEGLFANYNTASGGFLSLTDIFFNNGITRFYSNCFLYCTQLKITTLPDTVTRLDAQSFGYCSSLKKMSMNNVDTISGNYNGNYGAFRACSSLKQVWIGSSIQSSNFGRFAFFDCGALEKMYINLPRATVEGFTNYQYAFMNDTSKTGIIICNDDNDFIDKATFDALVIN